MKPRVAFFDFTCCEGCQLQVINLEESVIDLAGIVDVVEFREAMKERSDSYDIAFIEGSIVRPMDEERLKKIRERAKILIALGACSCIGGINALRKGMPIEEVKKTVYGDADLSNNRYFNVGEVKAVDEVVKVDFYIPGCPITKTEFAKVVSELVLGKKPELPNYPVCVECKKKQNICVFEKGKFCLGPIIRGGCEAPCPTAGGGCEGCRGMLTHPNVESEFGVLTKYGLTLEQAMDRFSLYWKKTDFTPAIKAYKEKSSK